MNFVGNIAGVIPPPSNLRNVDDVKVETPSATLFQLTRPEETQKPNSLRLIWFDLSFLLLLFLLLFPPLYSPSSSWLPPSPSFSCMKRNRKLAIGSSGLQSAKVDPDLINSAHSHATFIQLSLGFVALNVRYFNSRPLINGRFQLNWKFGRPRRPMAANWSEIRPPNWLKRCNCFNQFHIFTRKIWKKKKRKKKLDEKLNLNWTWNDPESNWNWPNLIFGPKLNQSWSKNEI